MKKYWFLTFAAALLVSAPAYSQDASVIQQELGDLREDIKILQRKMYNLGDEGDLGVQVGRLDQQVRDMTGRLDELDHKIKALDDKINMINKDIDVRMNLLEGKKIKASGNVSNVDNSPKFAAPVATNAPQAIVGGSISKGDDLQPVKGSSAEEIYQSGLEALKAKDYDKAEKAFGKILDKFPKDEHAGNAQYWLGESFYARNEYEKAAVAFAKGYQQYHSGNKAADSLLKLGMSMQGLDKKKEACAAFVSLPKEFPKAAKSLKDKAAEEVKKLGCK